MRLPLLLSLFLLPVTGLMAQTTSFERYLDSGREDIGRSLVLQPDGVAVVGYTEPTDRSSRRGSVYLADRDGRVRGGRGFPSPRRNYFLDATPSPADGPGAFLIAGWNNDSITLDNWTFYRMDAGGNQVGAFGWGDFLKDEEVFGVTTLPDQSLVAVGAESTTNDAVIARFTATGEDLWRRNFSVPGSRFTSLQRVAVAEGGVLAVGWSTEAEETYSTILVKYDLDGNLLWRRKFDFPNQARGGFRHLVALPSGRILLVSHVVASATDVDIVLIRLDPGGNLDRAGRIGSDGRDVVGAAHPSRDGQEGFLLAGGHRPADGSPGSAFLMGITDLNTLAFEAQVFAVGLDARFSDMAIDAQGNYWMAGTATPCPGGDQDVLLVKTGPDLLTPASACNEVDWALDAAPATDIVMSVAGDSRVRTDPPAATLVAVPRPLLGQSRSCPAYDLDGDNSSGATGLDFLRLEACYTEPFAVADRDLRPSRPGTVTDSIVVELIPARPGEFLALEDRTVRGSGTARLVIVNDGQLTDAQLAGLLGSVTYHNENLNVSGGERTVLVTAQTGCFPGDPSRFTFRLTPDLRRANVLGDSVLCPGRELVLDATTEGTLAYDWGDGAQDARLVVNEPGTYVVTRTNACSVSTDTSVVTAAASPTFPSFRPFPLCPGDSVTVDLAVPRVTFYRWEDGATQSQRTFDQPTELTVALGNGCVDTTLRVLINGDDCCPIYLPNAFSPDSDGVNDVFRAFPHPRDCRAVSAYRLQVYDRWGGEVYAGDTLTSGWDGNVGGQAAAAGHYVYVVTYHDGFTRRERRGGVVLIR